MSTSQTSLDTAQCSRRYGSKGINTVGTASPSWARFLMERSARHTQPHRMVELYGADLELVTYCQLGRGVLVGCLQIHFIVRTPKKPGISADSVIVG